eukprot:9904459-Heterocapsa_arctica.AAC.1
MPEDRSRTIINMLKPSNTFKAMYTCLCTPVGLYETRVSSRPPGMFVLCRLAHDVWKTISVSLGSQ